MCALFIFIIRTKVSKKKKVPFCISIEFKIRIGIKNFQIIPNTYQHYAVYAKLIWIENAFFVVFLFDKDYRKLARSCSVEHGMEAERNQCQQSQEAERRQCQWSQEKGTPWYHWSGILRATSFTMPNGGATSSAEPRSGLMTSVEPDGGATSLAEPGQSDDFGRTR